jgi:hypothetical protein
MAENTSSGGTRQPQNTDSPRAPDPPRRASKDAPGPANTPKSSPDAAIPPEKLTAENDK